MSTTKVTSGKSYARLAAKAFAPQADKVNRPVAEDSDTGALQIDESFDAACDPYNNTGQHLVSALKKKYEG